MKKIQKKYVCWSVLSYLYLSSWAYCQSISNGWKTQFTNTSPTETTSPIYRVGGVAISQGFKSPYINRLLATSVYDGANDNRTVFFSMNEPRLDLSIPDSTTVGLATRSNEGHNVMTINHFANFRQGINFTDNHTSTTEMNFFRGSSDRYGFRDGGDMLQAAVLKVAGNFGNNGRNYKTTNFDLINLRFFTSDVANNPARIENFYAIRLEEFRGINISMIQNSWGIYMAPKHLNNYLEGSWASEHPLLAMHLL